MNTKLWIVIVGLFLLAPLSLQAAVFQSGDTVSLTQPSKDDVFLSGNTVTLNEDVTGDAFTAGKSITISAPAAANVYAAGETIRLTAPVKQDLMAAGRLISITAPTVERIFAAGNNIEIGPDTTVNHNVYVAGQTIDIAGTINGSVYAAGENIRLKAGTVVKGDLYTTGQNPIIEDNVTITGQQIHKDQKPPQTNQSRNVLLNWLRSVVSWFIVSMLAWYILPVFAQTVVTTSLRHSGRALAIGALWLLAFVPATIVLFITILGIPFAFTLIFLSLAFIMIAMIYAPLVIGSWVMNRLQPATAKAITWQHILLGVVVNEVLWIVPIVGPLISLVIFILSLGAFLLTIWRQLRSETLDTPITPTPL